MRSLIIIILIVFTSLNIWSQDNRLIFQENENKSAVKISSDNSKVSTVNIDVSNILKSNSFSVQFDRHDFVIDKIQIIDRGINGYGFWGEEMSNGSSIVHLSIMNEEISGFINIEENKYIVSTSADGQYLISKVVKDMIIDRSNDVFINLAEEKSSSISQLSSSTEKHRKIRILVLHTSSAGTSSNLLGRLETTIEYTNKTFKNSKIDAEVELVYFGQTSYTETCSDSDTNNDNLSTDLTYFRNKNDGVMDEVHQLRDLVHADVCVLICKTHEGLTYSVAGIATPAASSESAFMIVGRNFIGNDVTFAHELGHLVGCKHAHAYEYESGNLKFQTLMSETGNAYEIPYWSNHLAYYQGVALAAHQINSASVWASKYNTVLGFRIVPDNLTLTTSPISGSYYYQFRANESLEINGVSIPNNKKVKLKSKTVTIGNNFSIAANSQLEISTN